MPTSSILSDNFKHCVVEPTTISQEFNLLFQFKHLSNIISDEDEPLFHLIMASMI